MSGLVRKIVRTDYPVDRLPKELSRDLLPDLPVVVTIEQHVRTPEKALAALEDVMRLVERRPPAGDDPVERIRKLRDEWDD
jgi:hypothetical protein